MSNKEAALAYLARGWSVFPLINKCTPRVKWKPYQELLPSKQQVEEWWDTWPDAWIGVVLGPVSNLVRIDADGEAGLKKLEEYNGGPLQSLTDSTLTFQSPSGGFGWLFKHKSYIETDKLWGGEGEHEEVRIQAKGAYTAIPTSPGYEWLNDKEVVDIPDWVRSIIAGRMVLLSRESTDVVSPTLRHLDEAEIANALPFIPADDYDTWVQVGMALKAANMECSVWEEWSKRSDKYKDGECEAKWPTFEVYPGSKTARYIGWMARQNGWINLNKHEDLSDTGCANVLARMAHGKIKHSPTIKCWISWDGKRWLLGQGAEGVLVELQKACIIYRKKRMIAKVQPLVTPEMTKDDLARVKGAQQFLKALNAVSTGNRLREIRFLIESDPLITCDYKDFNKKPHLLNCTNGTLDLTTCELRAHEPSDLLTQLCPTEYNPDAVCPRWERFFDEVFSDDKELVRWVQKLLGYCTTGFIGLHLLPIMWGKGRNGKSTLVKTMIHVLGNDYAGTTPSGFLSIHKANTHDTKYFELFGKRFVVDMETSDDMQLNEEMMKRLTGGDQIKVRRMCEDYWHFEPTHKLLLATNYEPTVRGTDDAVWGRLLKVPFLVSFLGREDPELDATLTSEAPGILAWLVRGCTLWQQEGLKPYPAAVKTATEEYRSDQDTIQKFFEERLIIDSNAEAPKPAVIAAYHLWCYNNKVKQLSSKAFGQALQKWFAKTAGREPESTNKVYKSLKLL